VLTTHTDTPVVTETTMGADLFQSLKILTELRVNGIGQDLRVFAVNDIALPVQEPERYLELGRVLKDGDNAFQLVRVELAGSLVQVDVGLFAHYI